MRTWNIFPFSLASTTGMRFDARRTVTSTPAKKTPAGKDMEFKNQQIGKASEIQFDMSAFNINDHVQTVQRSLEFTIDRNSGQRVINVVDADSKKLIRQIPQKHFRR